MVRHTKNGSESLSHEKWFQRFFHTQNDFKELFKGKNVSEGLSKGKWFLRARHSQNGFRDLKENITTHNLFWRCLGDSSTTYCTVNPSKVQ